MMINCLPHTVHKTVLIPTLSNFEIRKNFFFLFFIVLLLSNRNRRSFFHTFNSFIVAFDNHLRDCFPLSHTLNKISNMHKKAGILSFLLKISSFSRDLRTFFKFLSTQNFILGEKSIMVDCLT